MSRSVDRPAAPAETVLGHSPFKLLPPRPGTAAPVAVEPAVVVSHELLGSAPQRARATTPPAVASDAVSVFEALTNGTTVTESEPKQARWAQVANIVLPTETVATPANVAAMTPQVAAIIPKAAATPVVELPLANRSNPTFDLPIRQNGWQRMVWVIGAAVVATIGALAFWLWPQQTQTRAHRSPASTSASASASPSPSPSPSPSSTPNPNPNPNPSPHPNPSPAVAAAPPPKPAPIRTPSELATTIDHGSCAVHVDADVPGSVVMIDGRVIGEAPAEADGIYCGRHIRVTVANPRFAPWERSVVLEEAKPAVVRADLRRYTTALAVTSTPAGATVKVNGRAVGTTPAAIPVVAELATTIEVSMPGYADFAKQLVPHAGATATIDAKLATAPLVLLPQK